MIAEDLAVIIRGRFYDLQQTALLEDDFDQYIATQCADGSWLDIAYAESFDWEPWLHSNRLAQLARVHTRKGHQLAGDPAVLQIICRGVDYWLHHKYQSSNWWYNYIGVPREFVVVAMLLGTQLDSARLDGVLSILDQTGTPAKSGSDEIWLPYSDQPNLLAGMKAGANLVWLAWNALFRAFLREDHDMLSVCAQLVWEDVNIGGVEGIQVDGAFYQHGARMQNFHYGLAFLENLLELAWLLRDTPLAMPEEKRQIISRYLLDGSRWMCRGDATVPGTLDRAATRIDALRVRELSRLLMLWRDVAPEVADNLDVILTSQSSGAAAVQGFRHFPRGDFSAYHRPHFSVFLKTVSMRTELSEMMNGENLRGVPYLNCGDHYLLQHGDEYYNLPPVWEWSSLPGLTVSSVPTIPVRTPYVGGVGNGQSGCVVMNYAREDTTRPVEWSLRKFWAFHQDMMICLLGGWQLSLELNELTTSLEQCRRHGPVYVATGDTVLELPDGDHHLGDVRWALHRQVGYLPITRTSFRVNLAEVTGTWEQINAGYTQETPVTEQRLLLEMRHLQPGADTGFVVIGATDAKRLDTIAKDPTWTILANDETQQCLRFADGTTMAACYTPGAVTEKGRQLLCVDRPCLVMWNGSGIWVSDPSWSGGHLQVTWRERQYIVELPCDGRTMCLNER